MDRVSGSFLDRLPPHERRRLAALDAAEDLARRRLEGEPLQYLEGSAQFIDFEVSVDGRVLIPRPETEGLFELAVAQSSNPRVIADLGTGSGVLAIALARRFPRSEVHAVDDSPDALEVARDNAAALEVDVHLHLGNLFSALPPDLDGAADLVVSNPPYVAAGEWESLPVDVRREPRRALVAGPEGTETLLRIGAGVGRWLAPGGVVVCEIGETQAEGTIEAFSEVGPTEIRLDLTGRPRYVVSRREP
jgi:release factor glutamine methyltransferase